MRQYFVLTLAASTLLLPGCAGVVAGAGVAAGTAAVQEGGVSRAVDDARIQTEINNYWFQYDVSMFRKLDLTINQGRVLITGVVQDPAHRVEAVRMAWQPRGVIQVINEIKVADSDGIIGFAKDSWITTRLRSSLISWWDILISSTQSRRTQMKSAVARISIRKNKPVRTFRNKL